MVKVKAWVAMVTTHIILDFYKADRATLATSDKLKAAIDSALVKLGVVLNQDNYIQFEPEGVTATVIADGFHFSIHTWPEFHSCAIDLYTNRKASFATELAQALDKAFMAQEHDMKVLKRNPVIID
ncbi:MAG: S-adenosylmethionine decarboxylase [Candidatus Melainabacteria bacterium]|nr:S-adenosylmethionine decarboxylase [Candidatus Melainabacteria bacterium]